MVFIEIYKRILVIMWGCVENTRLNVNKICTKYYKSINKQHKNTTIGKIAYAI